MSDKLAELFDHIKNNQKPVKGNVFDLKGRPVEKAGTQSEFVFTYNGKPITEIRRSFRRAVKKAVMVYGMYEPDGVTFHTLLHTYGSYLMQQKTDFRTAQELMGHRDPKMTQRYTHVADNSKRCAVDGLNWESHVS